MQRYPASPEATYKKGVISLDNVYLGYSLDNRVIIGRLTLKWNKIALPFTRNLPKELSELVYYFSKEFIWN